MLNGQSYAPNSSWILHCIWTIKRLLGLKSRGPKISQLLRLATERLIVTSLQIWCSPHTWQLEQRTIEFLCWTKLSLSIKGLICLVYKCPSLSPYNSLKKKVGLHRYLPLLDPCREWTTLDKSGPHMLDLSMRSSGRLTLSLPSCIVQELSSWKQGTCNGKIQINLRICLYKVEHVCSHVTVITLKKTYE